MLIPVKMLLAANRGLSRFQIFVFFEQTCNEKSLGLFRGRVFSPKMKKENYRKMQIICEHSA